MPNVDLLPCRWRGAETYPGRVACRSPVVKAVAEGVMRHQCWMCQVIDHRDENAVAEVRPEAGRLRHLTYHVYPRGEAWRWNIAQLRARMPLFNGRRIIAVATDGDSDGLADVQAALEGWGIEWLHVPNSPERREAVTHLMLLERLADMTAPGDVTFYGHAKGISSHVHGPAVRQWTEEMYRGLLDYWPAVQRELVTHCCVGVFLRTRSPLPLSHVPWHYSGSFRWIRNADLYSRQWRLIDAGWEAPESYPAKHFTLAEAACLYGAFAGGTVALYAQETWDQWAAAAAAAWRKAHDRERTMLYADSGGVPQRLNLGCAGFYAAGWVNVDLDPDAPAEFHEDVQDLPSIADGIAVEIYAGHVLEHVEHVGRALRTWYRVLAPNGTLTVAVPDLPGALALWHAKAHFPGLDLAAGAGLLAVVCGLKDPTEFAAKPLSQHRRFFDSSSLALCMEAVGFRDLHQVDAHPLMVMPSSQLGWQVAVCGTKACG